MRGVLSQSALFTLCVVGVVTASVQAASDLPTKATGQGSMAFEVHEHKLVQDDDEPGRALIQFVVEIKDGKATGSLLFAAEHHHALYPDLIVRSSSIREAHFSEHAVKFTANGSLHNEAVRITAWATDGAHHDKGDGAESDSFKIICTNGKGEVVFEAHGELFSGDIVVGEAE